MKTFAVVAALAGLAIAAPSSVAADIAPSASAPAGCSTSYSGSFELSVAAESKKRASTALTLTLADGVLKDSEGRYGYIASNYQFQFDNPIQDGAIYTSGWSVCSNGSLALGGSTIFYECLSGTFYNLYDEDVAAQCTGIELLTVPVSGSGVSESTDGQITAASASTVVETILCQITDGQVQANTCLTTITYSAKTSSAAVITQISDGQIQASASVAVVSQISDGQIQATTAAATTAKTSVAVVSQISDGQIQATKAANSTVASTGSATSSTAAAVYTGGASAMKVEMFGLAAGLVALAAL